MIRSLRRKFVLATMLLVSLVLLAVFFGIGAYNQVNMERQSYMALQIALDRPGGEEPWFEVGGEVPEGYQRDPIFVVEVDDAGRITLLSSDRINVAEQKLGEIVPLALAGAAQQGELGDYGLRYMVRPGPGGARIAFTTLSFERQLLRQVVLTTAMFVVFAFFVFLVASLLLARWALKPVERSWEQQNRFVADASHELKTPLTVILANTGILKTSPDTSAEQMTWVDSTEKEAGRMKALVDNMLFLAKRDDGSPPPEKVRQNISTIVETSALAFESVAFERGLSLDVAAEGGLAALCDAPQIEQLVAILVDNAVKYAKDGSTIRVSLHRQQGQAVLAVFNEGAAIPAEQQPHLFERFYRTDASRSTEGSGLGLSIAETIVQEHKGKIFLHSDAAGTTFTAVFPAL